MQINVASFLHNNIDMLNYNSFSEDLCTVFRSDNFQEEIDQFKSLYRAGKGIDAPVHTRTLRQLFGMILFLVKELYPEGLVPKAFLAAFADKGE